MKPPSRLFRLLASFAPGLGALLIATSPASADLRLPRPSPRGTVSQTVGTTDIDVVYSRPGVKGRVIWGELVPFGKPWRTGANEPTQITFSGDVRVQDDSLPAGHYTLFTVPGPDTWTVVFTRDKVAWPAYEDKPERSALRIQVQPQAAEHEEWMRFSFENLTPSSADLVLHWEKLRLTIPMAFDVNGQVLKSARREVASAPPTDWRTAFRAADFLFAAGIEPELATKWADRSIAVQGNYSNLSLRARIYAKAGDTKLAVATGQRAIKAGKASRTKVDTSATEKLVAEWSGSSN